MTLTASQMALAEARAKDDLEYVRDKEGNLILPIPLSKIASAYGISLKITEFDDPEISGFFDPKSKTIWVSKFDPHNRQVFTIAHELGHARIHNLDETEVFYRKQPPIERQPPMEQEANWYAAALLMPEQEVKMRFKVYKGNIDLLSSIFGVSNTAMTYRLLNLGLLENHV